MADTIFSVTCRFYSVYEDKVLPLLHLIRAEDENEAWDMAMEMTFEFEAKRNAEMFPSALWFRGVPYFSDASFCAAASATLGKSVFPQTRGGEWFLFEDLKKPPLEKLEAGFLDIA